MVGTGPVGFATADRLRRAKYQVSLINSKTTLGVRRTFPAAAAFWTPFASGMTPKDEQNRSELTLNFYHDILEDPGYSMEETGIVNRQLDMHFLKDTLSHTPDWSKFPKLKFQRLKKAPYSIFDIAKFPELKRVLRGSAEVRAEFRYETPTIQVDRFMNWYSKRLQNELHVNVIDVSFPFVGPNSLKSHEWLEQWRKLIFDHQINHLVVCVGSNTVFGDLISPHYPSEDSFNPLKGVVAHLEIRPTKQCSTILFEGGFFDTDTLYLVPLIDRYVLGGTVHSVGRRDDESSWQVQEAEKKGIIERAQCFLPKKHKNLLQKSGLFDSPMNEQITWMAGVRPKLRNGPIVMESDVLSDFISSPKAPDKTLVFLHYGHGGSGFTMCHDSAEQVVNELGKRLAPEAN